MCTHAVALDLFAVLGQACERLLELLLRGDELIRERERGRLEVVNRAPKTREVRRGIEVWGCGNLLDSMIVSSADYA